MQTQMISLLMAMFLVFASIMSPAAAMSPFAARADVMMWLDHLGSQLDDTIIDTSFTVLRSKVGRGLAPWDIHSTTLGIPGFLVGNKEVDIKVNTIPEYNIVGLKVCYELSEPRTYICHLRFEQVKNPSALSSVSLDYTTKLTNKGRTWMRSVPILINPDNGNVRLSFRINTGNPADYIRVRAIGLVLSPKHK